MAKIGSMEMDFKAEDDGVKKAYGDIDKGNKKVKKSTDDYNKSAKKASKSTQNLGGSLGSLVKKFGLLAIGLQGIKLAFRETIGGALDFEKRMANVNTLLGQSKDQITAFGKQVLDISTRVPVDKSVLSESLYDIVSSGISDTAQALNVLENSAKLSVAGLGSVSEATDLVTSAMNAFQLTGEEADRVYDTIFKTVKSGKTTIAALSQGFGAVAGVVAAANIEFDDFQSAVAALTTTGLPASQAYSQLKAAIAGLTRETKESKVVFDSLGVKTFKELVQKTGGMSNAFRALKAQFGDNDAALIKLVGSVEGYNAILSLSGAQAQSQVDTLAQMRSGVDALEEAFETQKNTLSAQVDILKNQLSAVLVNLGTAVMPAVTATVAFFNQNLEALIPILAVLGTAIAGFALKVIGVSSAAVLLNPVLLLIVATVGLLTAAFIEWNSKIDESTIKLNESVIEAESMAGKYEKVVDVLNGADKERAQLQQQLQEKTAAINTAILEKEKAEKLDFWEWQGIMTNNAAKEHHEAELEKLQSVINTAEKERDVTIDKLRDLTEANKDHQSFLKISNSELATFVTDVNKAEIKKRIELIGEEGIANEKVQRAILKMRGEVGRKEIQVAQQKWNILAQQAFGFKKNLVSLFSVPITQNVKINLLKVGQKAGGLVGIGGLFDPKNISNVINRATEAQFNKQLSQLSDTIAKTPLTPGAGGGGGRKEKPLSDEFKKQLDIIKEDFKSFRDDATESTRDFVDSHISAMEKFAKIDDSVLKKRIDKFKEGTKKMFDESLSEDKIKAIAENFGILLDDINESIVSSISDNFTKNLDAVGTAIEKLATSDLLPKDIFEIPDVSEVVDEAGWMDFWDNYSKGIEAVQKRLEKLSQDQKKTFDDVRKSTEDISKSLINLEKKSGEELAQVIFKQEQKLRELQDKLKKEERGTDRGKELQAQVKEIESILKQHAGVRGQVAGEIAEMERREALDPIAKLKEDLAKEKSVLEERLRINQAFFEDTEMKKPRALADIIAQLQTLRGGLANEENQEFLNRLLQEQQQRQIELDQAKTFLEAARSQKEGIEGKFTDFLAQERLQQTQDFANQLITQETLLTEHAQKQIAEYNKIADAARRAGQALPAAAEIIPGRGFKEGGFTGAGNKSAIAGLVHKNEYVIPSKLVNKLKPTGFLGMIEGMRKGLKGFADGGPTSGNIQPSTTTNNFNIPTTIRADQSVPAFGAELLFQAKKYL